MNPLTLAVGLAVGATVTAPITWRITWRYGVTRGDIASYDHRRDWRAIAAQADHDHRTAIRWARALHALDRIHRDVIGDLLDTVAGLQTENDLLRAPHPARPSPIPPYGRTAA